MSRSLDAIALKRIFLASIAAMILLGLFGFSWLNSTLKQSAQDTNHAQIDANLSRDTIEQLRFLDTYTQKNKDTIARTAAIVADSKKYSYQNQIVADINTYANRAGVAVLGYNFDATTQKGSNIVAGLKTISATLTLEAPIPYTNFLRFLKAIEGNLTKMQVSGVSISPDTNGGQQISNPTIVVEVYVK